MRSGRKGSRDAFGKVIVFRECREVSDKRARTVCNTHLISPPLPPRYAALRGPLPSPEGTAFWGSPRRQGYTRARTKIRGQSDVAPYAWTDCISVIRYKQTLRKPHRRSCIIATQGTAPLYHVLRTRHRGQSPCIALRGFAPLRMTLGG